jgi:gluconolactonase
MDDARVVASGLRFPEGPVALDDGSVLCVELAGRTLSRVAPDGEIEVVSELGGSPNGAAVGPDGAVYVCNSGGFVFREVMGLTVPQGEHGETEPDGYTGGRIQRVDLTTGASSDLYTHCDGHALRGPNDLVFDGAGGFWFTDHGKRRRRDEDRGGLYYAAADGSSVREVVYPLDAPNGIGLSPDGRRLYVAETHAGRLWAWDLAGPGELAAAPSAGLGDGRTLVTGLPGMQLLDSLAVEEGGAVCVATLVAGGISVVTPEGGVSFVALEGELADPLVTNLCFGGDDRRTAFVTLSGTGRLVAGTWPRPGLHLAY